MNKKLICLLLSVVMLLSVVLTSCKGKGDEEALENITTEASATAVTLSVFLMSEAPVSAEQELAMENAVNEITKARFKAKLDLTFLTPDAYYAALEENLKKQSENADLYYTEDTGEEPETEKDDLGIETLKYPALKPNQVDIFYFSGYDKFSSYLNNNYLNILNEEVDGDAKALKSYLTPSILNYMKSVNGGMYAIPTNRPIGEYTYLLLNKEVLKEMYYDTHNTKFTSLTDENVQDILEYVVAANLDYVPLHSFTGELDVLNYQYWGVDANGQLSNQFSIIGGSIDPSWEMGKEKSFSYVNNSFADEGFLKQLSVLGAYKRAGYYDPAAYAAGKDFAVGYIKGGPELEKIYGDKYELVPVATPTLYTQDLYQDMFAVSAYTVNLSRSMDVLTYLNTNEEFRNLILYGIEGENYELVNSNVLDVNGDPYKQVKRLNNNYMMDLYKTGNTLLAYTLEGEDPLLREYAKAQNRDIKPAYSIGLLLDYDALPLNMMYMHQVRELSESIMDEIKTKNPAEFTDDYIASLKTRVNQSMAVAYTRNKEMYSPDASGKMQCSFTYLYFTWLEATGLYIPPKDENALE